MKLKSVFVLVASMLVGSFAFAGPFVSEGVGMDGTILSCRSLNNQSAFLIRKTMAATVVQGLYKTATGVANMTCEIQLDKNTKQNVWSCYQVGVPGGENVLYATAYENSQGFIIAQIYQRNMIAQVVPVDSLVCKTAN